MNHHLKTFVATFLAASLLYYTAAWAVLLCGHDDHETTGEVILFEANLANQHSHVSSPSHAPTQIGCLDFDYQTEVFAGSASPPQFHRATDALTPRANDCFVLQSLLDSHRKNLLRNVFTSSSPPDELSDPPLYLSLSSLRI